MWCCFEMDIHSKDKMETALSEISVLKILNSECVALGEAGAAALCLLLKGGQ